MGAIGIRLTACKKQSRQLLSAAFKHDMSERMLAEMQSAFDCAFIIWSDEKISTV